MSTKVPSKWIKTNLGTILEFKYGKALPAKTRDGMGAPVYGSNGIVGNHSLPLIKTLGIVIGRKGSFGEVNLVNEPFSPIDTTYYVDELFSQPIKYWFYLLKKLPLTTLNRSTAIPGLNRDDAYSQEVFLPSLAEQQEIVALLDKHLAQVESTKNRLDAIPEILKRFRQSVLAAAVSGKLTEEWRNVNETTSVKSSIIEILADRSKRVTSRTEVPQLHLSSDEYKIPKKWKWVSLDTLSSKIVDGVHHKPEYIAEGIPFMSVKDIKNGEITFDYCKYISKDSHTQMHPRCNPEKGDLLITKSGTIGRTAIVYTDVIFDLFVSVALIKPASKKVNMNFIDISLRHWVNSIDVSSRIVGTAIKNLHLRDMRVLAIPFAPIEEQTEIVRRVEELFAYADKIETQVNAAQERVNNLTQSVLAKAFNGELTAQWRAQNPDLISGENSSAALLEKIKAERATLTAKKKPAKKPTARKEKTSRENSD